MRSPSLFPPRIATEENKVVTESDESDEEDDDEEDDIEMPTGPPPDSDESDGDSDDDIALPPGPPPIRPGSGIAVCPSFMNHNTY